MEVLNSSREKVCIRKYLLFELGRTHEDRRNDENDVIMVAYENRLILFVTLRATIHTTCMFETAMAYDAFFGVPQSKDLSV